MKKVLSMILVIAVLLSCMTVTAFAASAKISDSLLQVMKATSEDAKIKVHVWLYSNGDKEAARRQARKECGYIGGLPLNMTLDEVYTYRAAYNRIVSEQEAAVANSFVEKLGIAEEDIVYCGKHPYVIAMLSKAQINEAATYVEVESLSYVEDIAAEPSTGSNTKISESLQKAMKAMPDNEKIETCIWLYYQHNADLIERKTFEECGLTAGTCMTLEEVDIYSKTYNRIAGELEAAGNKALIEKIGVADEDIIFCGTLSPLVILNLTKEQVYSIAELDEVQLLDDDNTVLVNEPTPSSDSYRSRFNDYCDRQANDVEVLYYKELYHHKDKNGDTDWVLINGSTNMGYPAPLNTTIGNRVIRLDSCGVPFDSGYGIYDVKNDTFIDAISAARKGYDGFAKVFDELGGGRLLGDLDGDNQLTIIDATIMQRCQVGVRDYPIDDEIKVDNGMWNYSANYYSDFDRDGVRSILDVTKLQRYLIY